MLLSEVYKVEQLHNWKSTGNIVLISKIVFSSPSGNPALRNRNPGSAPLCSYLSCHFLICF